jgi:hypothetical protein
LRVDFGVAAGGLDDSDGRLRESEEYGAVVDDAVNGRGAEHED